MTQKPKAIVGQKGIKYGLQSVFGADEEEPQEEAYDWRKKVAQDAAKNQRKSTVDTDKALGDDPLAFEYDAVYDEMKGVAPKPTKPSRAAQAKQAPKYITSLLDAAKKREVEREMVMQKQIQKQAEVEKELMGDIEQFITPTYKKKLEEQRKFEEEQRKKEELEKRHQVEGKSDMMGFYRNLLTKNVAFGANDAENKADSNKQEKKDEKNGENKIDKKSSREKDDKYGRDDSRDKKEDRKDRRDYKDDDRDINKDKKYRRSRSRSRDRKRDRSRSRSRDRSSRTDSYRRSDTKNRRSPSRSPSRSEGDKKRKREDDPKSIPAQDSKSDKTTNNSDNSVAKGSTVAIEEDKPKFARRNDDQAVTSARERYLQRKAQMEAAANADANK